jgi:two-component system, chemotaxis family, sensor kinase CheA
MGVKDEEFLKKLLSIFTIEAQEHITAIANGLIELEKSPTGPEKTDIVEVMYREAHSLKGAARSVNMGDIEAVCQAMESIFSAFKTDRINVSTELFDTLHRAADAMTELLADPRSVEVQPIVELLGLLESDKVPTSAQSRAAKKQEKKTPGAPTEAVSPGGMRPRPSGVHGSASEADPRPASARDGSTLSNIAEPGAKKSEKRPGEDAPVVNASTVEEPESASGGLKRERSMQTETVRIAVEKLDPLLRQVGEMVSVKLTTRQRVSDLLEVISTIDQWKQRWANLSSQGKTLGALMGNKSSVAAPGKNDGQLAKLLEFLDWNRDCIKTLEDKIKVLAKSAQNDSRMQGAMVDELMEDMMNVLMLPCSSMLELFPKLVRDLARDSAKEVNLVIHGGDLEIDRRILEEMKEPLIHLVRNSIDHGIETPDERVRNQKPRQGTLTLAISQVSGNQIELVVSDDGAGIDVVKVREAAARRGMVSEQEKYRLDNQDALSLVFRSEVSTSPIVSNISGRGLGLAIVREKVENLGGNISVATAPGLGASFRILLPVTLSTFRGILVRTSEQLFIIPTANVERVARIKRELIKTVGNRETIEVNGRALPLVHLGDVLELPRQEKKLDDTEFIPVLILSAAERRVSFRVDKILQEQEVLVKPLGRQLSRLRNVAGATVLGSGKLAPILNVSDLIKSATKRVFAAAGPAVRVEEVEGQNRSVLVVEDSITSRMLLKNILESAGYKVTTSVDGADAWASLKTEHFDLVVSDIEMPRMSGFELTASIRSDEKLSDLPVVLVTSLGSREDRERGIDVGANAYIVKGSFDQNNLLEIVERLV